MNSSLISLITTENGYLIDTCYENFYSQFNSYELANIPYYDKKFVVTDIYNYIFYKLPLKFANSSLCMFVFERWRLVSQEYIFSENIKIKNPFKNINNFSSDEQEVIFSLLCGYIQDKEIINFITTYKSEKLPCVKYIIKTLFDKFEVNSRTLLIQSLKTHELDKYIPKTLIKPGVYNNKNIFKTTDCCINDTMTPC